MDILSIKGRIACMGGLIVDYDIRVIAVKCSQVHKSFLFAFFQIGIFNLAWKVETEETFPINRREYGVICEEQQTAKKVAESTL